MKLSCSKYWQNPQLIVAVHYFQKQPPEVFCKKGVLKKFANFIGKHLFRSLFLIKLKLQRRCFPVKFAKFLRTSFWKSICERMFLCFPYNSHHHYHYHHFHYHRKMHFYRLRMLLTIVTAQSGFE